MATPRSFTSRTRDAIMHTVAPLRMRWNALNRDRRVQLLSAASFIAAALVVAFVLLPALASRKASTARLPQLEAQLAAMRSQAKEIIALTGAPTVSAAPRTAADVASLRAIFGPAAQVTAMPDGFRILMPSIAYASWWDKTGEAMSRHGLLLREATLAKVDTATGSTTVTVDMRLGTETRVAASPVNATPVQGK
ncbi:MAG: type II secretion system protein M [Burkholderiales bacterium]|nr:type II secretion system protein M [Burkholderiales bacterium]